MHGFDCVQLTMESFGTCINFTCKFNNLNKFVNNTFTKEVAILEFGEFDNNHQPVQPLTQAFTTGISISAMLIIKRKTLKIFVNEKHEIRKREIVNSCNNTT